MTATTLPCWATRAEIMGLQAASDEWASADCGHNHTQIISALELDDETAASLQNAIDCCYQYVHAMCDLDANHNPVPHHFVPQSQIELTFE